MIHTVSNPTYICQDCEHTWKSRPIRIVITDDLELPPCPKCGGTMKVGGILLSIMSEPEYDETIADNIRQNFGKAYGDEVRRSIAGFRARITG